MAIVVGSAVVPPHRPPLAERAFRLVHATTRFAQTCVIRSAFCGGYGTPSGHQFRDQFGSAILGQRWIGTTPQPPFDYEIAAVWRYGIRRAATHIATRIKALRADGCDYPISDIKA